MKRCRYTKYNNSEATSHKMLQSVCPIHYHEIRLKNNQQRRFTYQLQLMEKKNYVPYIFPISRSHRTNSLQKLVSFYSDALSRAFVTKGETIVLMEPK